MWCVRRLVNLFKMSCLCISLALNIAIASESTLSLDGLPRFNDSPARLPVTGFGFHFEAIPAVGQWQYEIAGELGMGYRLGFFTAYTALDSVYVRSYTEVDYSRNIRNFVLGGAYGFSMEWIPGGDLWTRHRYKLGLSYGLASWHAGGMISCYFDNLGSPDFVVGGGVVAADILDFFMEWDGAFLNLGTAVEFEHVQVEVSYRFPGFGISFSIYLLWDSWEAMGTYKITNESLDSFGGGLSKKREKRLSYRHLI